MLLERDNRLVFRYDAEELWVQPWGDNALRVRATKQRAMPEENWALQDLSNSSSPAQIIITEESGSISNGRIKAVITRLGKLTIYDATGKLLLEEYTRNRR